MLRAAPRVKVSTTKARPTLPRVTARVTGPAPSLPGSVMDHKVTRSNTLSALKVSPQIM